MMHKAILAQLKFFQKQGVKAVRVFPDCVIVYSGTDIAERLPISGVLEQAKAFGLSQMPDIPEGGLYLTIEELIVMLKSYDQRTGDTAS
jgi:hypothetical protein